MTTHLVIGDPHCTPKASNERFTWAGRMARDLKVDKVICMGDFASMDSLSSYDKGKKQFEGRRYKKDIEHPHDALKKFMVDGVNEGVFNQGGILRLASQRYAFKAGSDAYWKATVAQRALKDLADDIGYDSIEQIIDKKRKAIEKRRWIKNCRKS